MEVPSFMFLWVSFSVVVMNVGMKGFANLMELVHVKFGVS